MGSAASCGGKAGAVSESYTGPCSLEAALAAAEPKGGIRLAESCPNGDLVAVATKNRVRIRRKAAQSGRCGSVDGTGEWMDVTPWLESRQWRPI